MKITKKVLVEKVHLMNVGVMGDYPFGLKIEPSGGEYCLSLLWRHSVSRSNILLVGPPRDIMSALIAIERLALASRDAAFELLR